MTCVCGLTVFVKKTGECQPCYNRRYWAERRPAKPTPIVRAMVTMQDLSGIESELLSAYKEHRRVITIAAASLWKVENPEKVSESKAEYRARMRLVIRDRDAKYRAENAENIRAYNEAHREEARFRAARYEAANKEKIAARKKTRYELVRVQNRKAIAA